MSYDSTGGYHGSCRYRTQTAYQTPIAHRHGYTEPQLTTQEHGAVVAGCSMTCAAVAVPIVALHRFYFLCDVPGESGRAYMSDKRARFFRVLFRTRWWRAGRMPPLAMKFAFLLSTFLVLRHWLETSAMAPHWANRRRGFVAGALTGGAYATVRHPFDVLRATSEATTGPRRFHGAMDVLCSALRERPKVLRGLYRGYSVALISRTIQYSLLFGVYNWWRYDGVYRHPVVLFLYCHFGVFLGMAARYPLQALRQQLHVVNSLTRGRPQGYRSVLLDLRRRHGITKLFDGFFRGKPILHAAPMALLLSMYDVCSRRYTEYLHPEAAAPATHAQALTSIRVPEYVLHPPPYEFAPK